MNAECLYLYWVCSCVLCGSICCMLAACSQACCNWSMHGGRVSQKYQRSALGEDQSIRIAAKIDAAMKSDQLFLDPALSLHKLARHVAISPSYISQTLNETIGKSFFDYVNQMRVEYAKPHIIEGKETVLAISLRAGFNARSSFYKAFKLETGQTPSAFRNAFQSSQKAEEAPIQV